MRLFIASPSPAVPDSCLNLEVKPCQRVQCVWKRSMVFAHMLQCMMRVKASKRTGLACEVDGACAATQPQSHMLAAGQLVSCHALCSSSRQRPRWASHHIDSVRAAVALLF
jgi:hypothetical protein